MSPQIIRRQLDAGAWGVTVATIHQAAACHAMGVKRILIANEIVGKTAQDMLFRWLAKDDALDLYCLADSTELVELLADASRHSASNRPLKLLVELGYVGGRTGAREMKEALDVARAINRTPGVALSGVEGFEGLFVFGEQADEEASLALPVLSFANQLVELFETCREEELFEADDPIVTAGGSAFYDIICDTLTKAGASVVSRSGCYVTHDCGVYEQHQAHVFARTGLHEGLFNALEVWSNVQSVPEPGLAILNFGKRDVGFDAGLPIPLKVRRTADARVTPAPPDWTITGLNDHHAYMRVSPGRSLAVGDAVGVGVSHPCTTFDKWKALFLVDQDYQVRSAVETLF
jgi:D-serine dehydratase